MLKLSKKADYGLIAANHLSRHYGEGACSVRDIAQAYSLPAGLLAKVLQRLVQKGLLRSQQGTRGGYKLARPPVFISALDVISAIDGPVMITSCQTERGQCVQTPLCTVKEPLRKVNERIVDALGRLSMAEMVARESLRG
ncbi:MAG: RrF2 family transcriptional regulator [Terriglobia bacterium]